MMGQVIAKADGNTGKLKESYIYANGERLLTKTYSYDDTGTVTVKSEYGFTDVQGSSVMTADAFTGEITSRTKYDPYGNLVWSNIHHPSSSIAEDRYSYTGKERNSEIGLVYFGARWYDGDTGRFVSTDLIDGYMTNPISINRYQYCYDNPATYTDPMGLDPVYPTDEPLLVKSTRVIKWRATDIPSVFYHVWERFWAQQWLTGMIFEISEFYDMKLKFLEPSYSQPSSGAPKIKEQIPDNFKKENFWEVWWQSQKEFFKFLGDYIEEDELAELAWWGKLAKGYYFGSGSAQIAMNWWSNIADNTNNLLLKGGSNLMGGFAALWCSNSWLDTSQILVFSSGFRNAGRVWYLKDGSSAYTIYDWGQLFRIEKHWIGKGAMRAVKWHIDAFWGAVRHFPWRF